MRSITTIGEEQEQRGCGATPPNRRIWKTPRVIVGTAAETKINDEGPFSDAFLPTPVS